MIGAQLIQTDVHNVTTSNEIQDKFGPGVFKLEVDIFIKVPLRSTNEDKKGILENKDSILIDPLNILNHIIDKSKQEVIDE